MKFYTYIIRCNDGYLYTGITYNLAKRLEVHSKGLCRNTKNKNPINLVYSQSFDNRNNAAKR